MKLCFATGVLAIPYAFGVVGYGPGIILLVCWGSMTTCKQLTHFSMSSTADKISKIMRTSCTSFE